jgi:hypothetical protein
MDTLLNPFRPGAGARPPELAGRQSEIDIVDLMVAKSRLPRNDGGLILYGLRGVGKTVLLNQLRHNVERAGWGTLYVEARPGAAGEAASRQSFARGLAMAARRFSRFSNAVSEMKEALSTVASFTFAVAGVSINVGAPQSKDRANSGLLEVDLEELVADLARPLAKNQSALGIFIDELQDLDQELLTALLAVQHRATQQDWPFYLIGAGLPTLRRSLGEARSYAERFQVREIGALSQESSIDAVLKPATELGVSFTQEALNRLLEASQGYPFFLQTYAKETWDLTPGPQIDLETVEAGIAEGNLTLDQAFFPARWERATTAEKQYLRAIGHLGGSSARTGEIARHLNTTPSALSPVRQTLIEKGIIFADQRGSVKFTVPHMDAFILRQSDELS